MHRILLVDDEAPVLRCLRRLLLRNQFTVETAGCAREALEKLEAFQPDFVLSDFRMPGMDGGALMAEVRRRLPGVVTAILSGFTDLEGVLAADEAGGVCGYFRKPWDDVELVTEVRRMIEERSR